MKIEVRKNILQTNAAAAARNRELLGQHDVCMVNLMASPGAGKTSTIIRAIENAGPLRLAVIEGDIASEIDSLAIEALDVTALQINTGGSCHLTAAMISSALGYLELEELDLIIIENVGNLVCPAEFDLGETARVMIASVAEGDDKPHKYPLMFREVDAVLVNKIDLLPYCDFDLDEFRQLVGRLNPRAPIIELSCKDGDGAGAWSRWLTDTAAKVTG
ncbi:MAG: hydrogenase nickel incorporation protein HypB [Actinomycetota bacterium]|jgi:hydrogenase nickel incorporation protein HypB|nr:hydrogenase nickel incorporation protein HypB [Actinomycetota bacterium]MDA8168057.1 hydrogenase nickel incorporation protein HypB [Actinomycetota bacterium]